MVSDRPSLATRLLLGGIAGFVATLPMTMAVRAIHRRLPARERYPAPPRELLDATVEAANAALEEESARDLTIAAHYLYGAGSGALVAALLPRPGIGAGAAAGAAIWAGSYLGWIPAVRLLKPASRHPARRNAMMIAAHLVWGAATAIALRELRADQEAILSAGPDREAAGHS